MFSLPSHNPEWISVFIPESVRQDARAYAEKMKKPDPLVCQFNGAYRGRDFSAILLDCLSNWAFSRWCTDNSIWHESNYMDDNAVDVLLDNEQAGLVSLVIVSMFATGGVASSTEGLRISHYRLQKEGVTLYICASFDGQYVTFHGMEPGPMIEMGEFVYDVRPLIYEVPIDKLSIPMSAVLDFYKRTEEKQKVFNGIFREDK